MLHGHCCIQGAFGTVRRAMLRPECGEPATVAVKMLRPHAQPRDKRRFLEEAVLMGVFDHRHVLRLLGCVSVGEPLMLVFEYMERGSLFKVRQLCCQPASLFDTNSG